MEGENFINNITIQIISKDQAISFIRAYHYSKVIPRLCQYFLGIYYHDKLSGVFELGWGTQPLQTIRKIFPKHDLITSDYLEIGKMCFLPKMNHNQYFGSLALSALVKWLKQNTDYLFLYTLADGIEGKSGYVYQSANFYYLGDFKTSVYRDCLTLEKIHPRSARVLLEENALLDGVKKRNWLTQEFCKQKGIDKINGRMFRYIYPLNKSALCILKCYPHYIRGNYPKDSCLIFEKRVSKGKYIKIQQPKFDRNACKYNTQNYNN